MRAGAQRAVQPHLRWRKWQVCARAAPVIITLASCSLCSPRQQCLQHPSLCLTQLHAAGDLQSPPRCRHLLCHAMQPTRTCGSTAASRASTSTGQNPWCANLASPRSPLCCWWHPTAAHSTASGHQDRPQGTQSPNSWQCCSSCSSSRSRHCQCCRQRLQRAVLRSSPRSSQHHLRLRATAAAQQPPPVGQHQSRPAASCRLA